MTASLGRTVSGSIPFFQYLTAAGNGTGSIDANLDFSVTPGEFYIQPASNEILWVSRFALTLADAGVPSDSDFGALSTLTNGIDFRVTINGVTTSIVAGNKVRTNRGLLGISENTTLISLGGNAFFLQAQGVFVSSLGIPVSLFGDANDRFSVVLNDNLLGLNMLRFVVSGVKRV